jgi:hypothetical protein
MLAARGDERRQGCVRIDDSSRAVLHVDPENQTDLRSCKMEDFETFLRTTPRRATRLRVGLTIALNILNLGLTPLLPARWTNKQVFIFHDPGNPVPQPYIGSTWGSDGHLMKQMFALGAGAGGKQARDSIFVLGVLLLELLFRDTLDRQHFRSQMLVMGQANDHTDLCAALVWQRRAEEEFGEEIAEAIRKCIVCAFEPAPDLSSSAFLQAVWMNVVRPLEEFLRAWSGGG